MRNKGLLKLIPLPFTLIISIIEAIKEVYAGIYIQHCETDGVFGHENGQLVNCIGASDSIGTPPSKENGLATIKN